MLAPYTLIIAEALIAESDPLVARYAPSFELPEPDAAALARPRSIPLLTADI